MSRYLILDDMADLIFDMGYIYCWTEHDDLVWFCRPTRPVFKLNTNNYS